MLENKIRCPSCLAENEVSATFCISCNVQIGKYSTIDPVFSAVAGGRTIADGIRKPTKLIIVIGIWLLFGIDIICYLFILGSVISWGATLENGGFLVVGIFTVLTLICLFFLIKVNLNYFKQKKCIRTTDD